MSLEAENSDRLRQMAEKLGALTEDDFQLLTGTTAATVEAWRKRGTGPAYVRMGNRYYYPVAAVADYMARQQRAPKVQANPLL